MKEILVMCRDQRAVRASMKDLASMFDQIREIDSRMSFQTHTGYRTIVVNNDTTYNFMSVENVASKYLTRGLSFDSVEINYDCGSHPFFKEAFLVTQTLLKGTRCETKSKTIKPENLMGEITELVENTEGFNKMNSVRYDYDINTRRPELQIEY